MRFPFALFILVIFCWGLHAQNVGIGTTTPDASSIFELSSVSKGFLPPQMTASAKLAIVTPKPGLMIYQTDGIKGLYVFMNGSWLLSGGNFVDLTSNQTINGNKIFVNDIIIDGVQVGIGNGNVATNTVLGSSALNSNTGGDASIAIGYQSLFKNNTGSGNSSIGFSSQYSNLNGSENTSIGRAALYNNFASGNSALGNFSLYANTFGSNNVAIGNNAMRLNTTHSNIVAVGDSALYHNGVGSLNFSGQGDGNTAIGSKSLIQNNTGYQNTATGFHSLLSNTAGHHNSAFGHSSLNFNIQGSYNSANGNHALYKNVVGEYNTSTGFNSLYNSNGDYNAAYGSESLLDNSTGSYNTAIGTKALNFSTSGNGNTGIGYRATTVGNQNNATAIGNLSYVACDNCMVLGSVKGLNGASQSVRVGIGSAIPIADLHIKQSSETYPLDGGGLSMERVTNSNHWEIGIDNSDDFDFIFNNVPKSYIRDTDGEYIKLSDRRLKKDILPIASVLPAIMALQAKTYHYIDNKAEAPLSYGFIAQEVEAIFPDFVDTKGDKNMKALAYQNFSVVAIKAIQEQQNIILSQQNKMDAMQLAINKTNDEIKLLKAQLANILSIDITK